MTTIKQFNPGSGQWETVLVGAPGPVGPKGDTGSAGANGAPGPAGPGVPVGGAAGQVLSKINATDFNTQWSNAGFDQGAADLRYLQLAGGTLTGPLTVEDSVTVLELISQGTIVAQSGISSAAGISVTSGNVTAPQVRASTAAPVAINDLTRKDYVDAADALRLTQAAADARYVNNTGGDAMAGLLTITGTTPWQILSLRHTNNPQLMFENPDGTDYGYLMGQTTGMTLAAAGAGGTIAINPNGGGGLLLSSTQIQANSPILLIGAAPSNDGHATSKGYVDTQDVLRVAKTGDTMTGPLILRDAAAGIDAKQFSVKSLAGVFTLQALTDAGAVQKTPFSYDRTADLISMSVPVTIAPAAGNNQFVVKGSTQSDVRLQSATGVAWGSVVAVAAGTDLMTHPTSSVIKLRPELTDVLTIAKTLITATTPIALPADPASLLHAATKQYVDANVGITQAAADSRYVNSTGDTIVGALYIQPSAQASTALRVVTGQVTAGGTADFDLIDAASVSVPTPSANAHAATKLYVDGLASQATLDARYVTQTGSESISGFKTFTDDTEFYSDVIMHANLVLDKDVGYGDLTLASDPTQPLHAATKQYVDGKVGTNPQTWEGTQAQFDALATIDPTWFYYVVP